MEPIYPYYDRENIFVKMYNITDFFKNSTQGNSKVTANCRS